MIRFLAQSTLMVIGNALGLLVAAAIVSDFHVSVTGFTLSLVFFTVAQIILAPFILQLAIQYVPAFRGGHSTRYDVCRTAAHNMAHQWFAHRERDGLGSRAICHMADIGCGGSIVAARAVQKGTC